MLFLIYLYRKLPHIIVTAKEGYAVCPATPNQKKCAVLQCAMLMTGHAFTETVPSPLHVHAKWGGKLLSHNFLSSTITYII